MCLIYFKLCLILINTDEQNNLRNFQQVVQMYFGSDRDQTGT